MTDVHAVPAIVSATDGGQSSVVAVPSMAVSMQQRVDARPKVRPPRRPSIAVTERWERNFELLKAFKNKYGHCKVPTRGDPDVAAEFPGLGKWVSAMRQANKAELLREKAALEQRPIKIRCTMRVTVAHRRRLTELGFVWNLPQHRWEQKFELLKEYKKEHGTCLVPARLPDKDAVKYKGLPYWVTNQRQARNNEIALRKGWHATTMHRILPENIDKLNSIDFVWNPREKREQQKREAEAQLRASSGAQDETHLAAIDQHIIARSAPFVPMESNADGSAPAKKPRK